MCMDANSLDRLVRLMRDYKHHRMLRRFPHQMVCNIGGSIFWIYSNACALLIRLIGITACPFV